MANDYEQLEGMAADFSDPDLVDCGMISCVLCRTALLKGNRGLTAHRPGESVTCTTAAEAVSMEVSGFVRVDDWKLIGMLYEMGIPYQKARTKLNVEPSKFRPQDIRHWAGQEVWALRGVMLAIQAADRFARNDWKVRDNQRRRAIHALRQDPDNVAVMESMLALGGADGAEFRAFLGGFPNTPIRPREKGKDVRGHYPEASGWVRDERDWKPKP